MSSYSNNAIERVFGSSTEFLKSKKPTPCQMNVSRWFIVNRDGCLREVSYEEKASILARQMDLAMPSYAPHKVVFMKEVPTAKNRNRKRQIK